MKTVLILALIFIVYNLFVLTFFDTIPRYNTPLLFFIHDSGLCGDCLATGCA